MPIAIVIVFNSEEDRARFNVSRLGQLRDEQKWAARGPVAGVWSWEGPPGSPTPTDGQYGIAILCNSRAEHDAVLGLLRANDTRYAQCMAPPPYSDLVDCDPMCALNQID
jgi:hypothetical protein